MQRMHTFVLQMNSGTHTTNESTQSSQSLKTP